MNIVISNVITDLEAKLRLEIENAAWYQRNWKETEERIIKLKFMINELKVIKVRP